MTLFKGPARVAPEFRLPTGALVLALSIFFGACAQDDPLEPDALEPTLNSIQANIFTPTCALSGCHAGAAPQEGLNLSAGQARQNLVDVASRQVPDLLRVNPGNANDSYLVIKLEGGGRMAPGTARMPFGAAPLTSQQIGVVREWINAGAP